MMNVLCVVCCVVLVLFVVDTIRTLQARVREECSGTGQNGTERFNTLFYSSINNQFRADVSYGSGISTYTQYFNYVC
jgi:uncharacterized protein YpmS